MTILHKYVDRSRPALRETAYPCNEVVENLQAQLAAAHERIAELESDFAGLLEDFNESEKRREF